jgi:hypothetical protein
MAEGKTAWPVLRAADPAYAGQATRATFASVLAKRESLLGDASGHATRSSWETAGRACDAAEPYRERVRAIRDVVRGASEAAHGAREVAKGAREASGIFREVAGVSSVSLQGSRDVEHVSRVRKHSFQGRGTSIRAVKMGFRRAASGSRFAASAGRVADNHPRFCGERFQARASGADEVASVSRRSEH